MSIRAVFIASVVCATASAAAPVVEVEANDYMDVINKHDTVLIEFWAPWCNHCVNLEPEYEAAAKNLEKDGIVFAKLNIDNTGNRAVAARYGVDGYPGLKVFTGGNLNKRASAHVSRIRDADFLTMFMKAVHEGTEHPIDPEVDDSQFDDAPAAKKTGAATPTSDKVLQLTSNSLFQKALNQNDVVLVMFHAPWCGHCKAMKPSFAEASTRLAPDEITLAQVDATALKDLAKLHGVSGYPTLKIFQDGAYVQDYEGGRTADDIVKYMKAFGSEPSGAPTDECLTVSYCAKNYAKCCANGNWQQGEGRKPVCKKAKKML